MKKSYWISSLSCSISRLSIYLSKVVYRLAYSPYFLQYSCWSSFWVAFSSASFRIDLAVTFISLLTDSISVSMEPQSAKASMTALHHIDLPPFSPSECRSPPGTVPLSATRTDEAWHTYSLP